jgi:hypothetical protein
VSSPKRLTDNRASMQSFANHWVSIDAKGTGRYETMFRWGPATGHLYAAAMIGPCLLALYHFGANRRERSPDAGRHRFGRNDQ